MDNNSSPWVEIVRQPAGRQRFHRGNDITLMCSMCGYNRPRYRKKSFSPQIKVCLIRLRSHRNIRYTVYGIRYTLFGIRYTLYGHGGSHRSSTCCQCALFVSIKKSCKFGVLHINEDSNI